MARRSAVSVCGQGDSAVANAAEQPAQQPSRRPMLRYAAMLAMIAVLFGGTGYFLLRRDDLPPPVQIRELTIVNIVLPPPPPPPPPPPEQKMIEQPKDAEQRLPEDKPLETPKEESIKDVKNEEPPGPLSLDAKAVGPGDLFNLGSKEGGSAFHGGGRGSRWGYYAAIVQSQIEAALRANPKTRNAVMQVQIRLWADSTGRVSRIQLVSSTGDAELDSIIRNEVFAGLMLRDPPPKDMPMPMVTRVTARRPS